jgi:hypothetical protein
MGQLSVGVLTRLQGICTKKERRSAHRQPGLHVQVRTQASGRSLRCVMQLTQPWDHLP